METVDITIIEIFLYTQPINREREGVALVHTYFPFALFPPFFLSCNRRAALRRLAPLVVVVDPRICFYCSSGGRLTDCNLLVMVANGYQSFPSSIYNKHTQMCRTTLKKFSYFFFIIIILFG